MGLGAGGRQRAAHPALTPYSYSSSKRQKYFRIPYITGSHLPTLNTSALREDTFPMDSVGP